jgi:hypothetical protein
MKKRELRERIAELEQDGKRDHASNVKSVSWVVDANDCLHEQIVTIERQLRASEETAVGRGKQNAELRERIEALEAFIARGGPLPEPPVGTSSWAEPPPTYTRHYDGGNP